MDENQVTQVKKSSKSINDLIIECSEHDTIKWIHMDVEGLDGELIFAIKPELLPDLLLFESLHIENNFYNVLCDYLSKHNYKTIKSGWNTICIKNKI